MNSKEKVLELKRATIIHEGADIVIEKQVLEFLIDYNLELDESLKSEVDKNTELMKKCNQQRRLIESQERILEGFISDTEVYENTELLER